MRYFLLLVIGIYQKILSPFIKSALGISKLCKFSPSCSEYAKASIQKYGIYKGMELALKRLIRCQPSYRVKAV